jgi:hypothetical protein
MKLFGALIIVALLFTGIFSRDVWAASMKKCNLDLESLELDSLRNVQFPNNEEQKSIIEAIKSKEKHVQKVIVTIGKFPKS